MAKVIVTAALTGGGSTPTMSPYLPITPQQLADEAVRAYEAGAAIAHVHVRNPETGQPSANIEYFRKVATKVKSRCNIIVCFTTGGTPDMAVAERARVVAELKPEIATFNAGSMNFGIFLGAERIKEYKYAWEKPHLPGRSSAIPRRPPFACTTWQVSTYMPRCAATSTRPSLTIHTVRN